MSYVAVGIVIISCHFNFHYRLPTSSAVMSSLVIDCHHQMSHVICHCRLSSSGVMSSLAIDCHHQLSHVICHCRLSSAGVMSSLVIDCHHQSKFTTVTLDFVITSRAASSQVNLLTHWWTSPQTKPQDGPTQKVKIDKDTKTVSMKVSSLHPLPPPSRDVGWDLRRTGLAPNWGKLDKSRNFKDF